MSCFGKCLSCVFCDCLCCECNCVIFPAYMTNNDSMPEEYTDHDLPFQRFSTFNVVPKPLKKKGKSIPYMELTSVRAQKSPKCFVYFHGNAENLGIVDSFLMPIVEQTGIKIYAIEYPSYGAYETCCPACISNTIKEDALLFYDHLTSSGKRHEDIYVMGRSIGSGGASYLANQRQVPLLILVSPFDTIRDVAMTMVGCIGCIVKQHFNNEE